MCEDTNGEWQKPRIPSELKTVTRLYGSSFDSQRVSFLQRSALKQNQESYWNKHYMEGQLLIMDDEMDRMVSSRES